VKRSKKCLFCFASKQNKAKKAKQSEKTFISFRLEAKQKNQTRNEAKRKIFGSETKRKYGVFISLWLKAKNSKRKEAK
jgi:hypothetical protein